jgi:subtilisin family serine protease
VDKRIAILDTGIDFRHELVLKYKNSKQITATKSWIQGRPGTVDDDGHGTHAAMLLLKVAPQAELYVAKVFNDQSNVTKEHIARAILWAVNQWEVNVLWLQKSPRQLPMQLRRMC